MPTLNILFALLLSSAPLDRLPQDTAPPPEESLEVERDVEYERLHSRYSNDLETWSIDEKRLRGEGVPKSRLPKHPGFEYQPQFAALAEKGSLDARLWMVQHPAFHGETAVARREVLQRWYRVIVRESPDVEFMDDVIEELGTSPRRIGEEFVLEILAEVSERSQNSEFIAAALYHRAWLLSERMTTEDPELRAEALESFMVIVTGYPQAKDAAKAAGVLYGLESLDLRAAIHAWCDVCHEVIDKGEGPEAWPDNPMHQFQPRMAILAAAGSGQAQQWTAQFYPAFDQRDRRARALGAVWLGQEFSNRRSSSEHAWMDLKFDLLQLVAEVSNGAEWAFDLVKGLDEEVAFFLPDRYAPVLRRMIDVSSDARVRDQARLTLARVLSKGTTFQELREAVTLFRELELGAAIERISKEAEEYLEALERVMPGAPAPVLTGKDAEGLAVDLEAYHGKVVLLWFWSFSRLEPTYFDEIRALKGRMAEEDFVILGVNCDLRSPRAFQREAVRYGITWRNVLQYRIKGHMTEAYSVHHWPTTFVIDAEGVLRGRNIDLLACEELARTLLEAGD